MASNRVQAAIVLMRERIKAGGANGALDTPEKVAAFEKRQDLMWEEHYAYQSAQSRAFAAGRLTLQEAQLIYQSLGEGYNEANGGWTTGTDLATKLVVTMVVAELMAPA